LTAPPLPRFLGYSMTTRFKLSLSASAKATSVVLSLEPSFAMMI
jgi:hypothetical protein